MLTDLKKLDIISVADCVREKKFATVREVYLQQGMTPQRFMEIVNELVKLGLVARIADSLSWTGDD